MLGDNLGTTTGKIVLQRILPAAAGSAKTESTQQGTGTLLGVEFKDAGTYSSELRPDGTIYGEGQGIYMGKGGEVATWKGQGVGLLQPGGGITFRGAIYLFSSSEKWAHLNKVACVYEYEVDANDNYKGEVWEWK